MADWNTLFLDDVNIKKIPDSSIFKFSKLLENTFKTKSLRVLDLGCGGGRHTIALAKLGYEVYATDNAPNAINLTKKCLNELDLNSTVYLADMTEKPWDNIKFHGIVCWDTINHNTFNNIKKTINNIHSSLLKEGTFIGTFKSDKADMFGKGIEIESKTFISNEGKEAGIPHHYFDEEQLRILFNNKNWDIIALAEIIVKYIERPKNFWEYNPFPFTTWGLLARKKCIV